MRRFQFQREMRLRHYTKISWLWKRVLFLIQSKDHLIPQVSSLKTPKAMFDALTKVFEGKNINKKITLRNLLKNVKIQNAETIQSYFTRFSQIKEQIEAVDEEVENAEIVMTALNGLTRSWDSFIQGIWARKNVHKKKLE